MVQQYCSTPKLERDGLMIEGYDKSERSREVLNASPMVLQSNAAYSRVCG